MKWVLLSAMFFFLAVLYGCQYDKEELLFPATRNCTTMPASFSVEIAPILQNSCALGSSCHGTGSSNGPGELMNYQQAKSAAGQIRSAVLSRLMPKEGTLPTEKINAISCWVDSGAPNN